MNPTSTLNRWDGLLFAFVLAALIVRVLLSPPIWQHGEAREGLVVQSIVQNQQWILPYRNGVLPSKPPLFHWLAALPALLFGTNDFIVRLPSVLGAFVMAWTTFILGRAMCGPNGAKFAVGALLGMYGFWNLGSQARVDMVFSACITASLAGFFFWHRDKSQIARIICYMASALAVLAKGPAGLVLPVLVIVGFFAVERRFPYIVSFWSWPLFAFVLLIDIGWYALAYHIGGNDFFGLQIWRENFDRFIGRGAFSGQSTSLSTVIWLANQTFPWNLALPWLMVRRVHGGGAREDSSGRFLHAWWIMIFGFFAVAARTRAVYLLPMYPAIALLATRVICNMISILSESRGLTSKKLPPRSGRNALSSTIVKQIGLAIVVFDLTLMLVNPDFWKERALRNARLAFIKETSAIVPGESRLFADPGIDIADTLVIAYRLGRKVESKSISCGVGNDYFLLPLDETPSSEMQTKILVSSNIEKMLLASVSSGESSTDRKPNCTDNPPSQLLSEIVDAPIDRQAE